MSTHRPQTEIPLTVTIDPHLHGKFIGVNAGEIGRYGGYLSFTEDPDTITAHHLWVHPDHRGQGIGERLVRRLVIEAQRRGIQFLSSHIESQYALDIRARIFGKEALRFFEDHPGTDRERFPEKFAELPITFDQARQSLVRAEGFENDLENRTIGFDVLVDLSTVRPPGSAGSQNPS